MTIYKLFTDSTKFMEPTISNSVIWEVLGEDTVFQIDRTPQHFSAEWQTLEIDFFSDTDVRDIPDLSVWINYLVLTARAHQELSGLLSSAGEFLPCTYQNQPFYLFNCLTIADDLAAIDAEVTKTNEFGDLERLGFSEKKLSHVPIFRTAQDYFNGLFCGDSLQRQIQSLGLMGLVFGSDLTAFR